MEFMDLMISNNSKQKIYKINGSIRSTQTINISQIYDKWRDLTNSNFIISVVDGQSTRYGGQYFIKGITSRISPNYNSNTGILSFSGRVTSVLYDDPSISGQYACAGYTNIEVYLVEGKIETIG